jgi:hypothetical protein
VIPNLDAKTRTKFTHASLLASARASRLNFSAKLAAPAASMTMPAKCSVSKLKLRRIRLPKDIANCGVIVAFTEVLTKRCLAKRR